MAAEEGNQYWKLAKKTLGRKRKFSTADEFLEQFLEYLSWSENNPILSKKASKREDIMEQTTDEERKGKRGQVYMESISKRRPLSMYGLCIFLGVSRKWFEMTITNLDEKEDNRTEEEEELFTVLTQARDFIEMQQFDGACVGEFNANIITRMLGLQDKKDITSNGNTVESTPTYINIIRDDRMAEGVTENED